MSEQFKREKDPTPENLDLEGQKYREMRAAEDEVDRIMGEIDNILASNPNREEAEEIILEKYAPLLNDAMEKSRKAFEMWLDEAKKAGEREKKELDDMEKDLGKE